MNASAVFWHLPVTSDIWGRSSEVRPALWRNLTQSFVHTILHARVGIANRHDSHFRFSPNLGIPAIKSAGNRKLVGPYKFSTISLAQRHTMPEQRSPARFTAKQANPKLRIMARLQEAKLLHKNCGGRNRKPHGHVIVSYEAVRLDEVPFAMDSKRKRRAPHAQTCQTQTNRKSCRTFCDNLSCSVTHSVQKTM